MIPRYEFLGERYSQRFQDQSVVNFYHLRPTYPPETFAILNKLIVDQPRVVLDVGCGTGTLARPLSVYTERIDAIDISKTMLERARTLPGGDSPKIRWQLGRAEDVELQPPYALITAGESLHWMDWGVTLPRFAQLLTPRGLLAIVNEEEQDTPWRAGYIQIVRRFSNNPHYRPIDLIAELEKYHLFQQRGEQTTAPVPLLQTIEDYTNAQHARSSLSLATLSDAQAGQFAREMHALLSPYAQDGYITVQVIGHVVWGTPLNGGQPLF